MILQNSNPKALMAKVSNKLSPSKNDSDLQVGFDKAGIWALEGFPFGHAVGAPLTTALKSTRSC